MSTPEDLVPVPSPLEAAPPAPAEMPAAPVAAQDLAVPSGAPYRVPAPPPEPPPQELSFGPPPRKPRPILGPALSVYAVFLWAFVVVGHFTTSWTFGAPFSQGYALLFVTLPLLVSWVSAIQRSRRAVPPMYTSRIFWRALGIAVIAVVFFVVTLFAATVAGEVSSRSHDFLIAFTLVLVSLLAAIAGPRMTSPVAPERTPRGRFVHVALWTAGTLLTLVAGIDLASGG